MKDYFSNIRECIDKHNTLTNEICHGKMELTDSEDEYYYNFALYFAHALLKDFGPDGYSRDELRLVAQIVLDVIDGDKS